MLQFLVRKSLRVIMILAGATLIAFLLMHAVPGNPWSNYSSSPRMILGLGDIDASVQRALNRHFGLDLPLWHQFTRYLIGDFDQQGGFICGAVCGNLGPSISQRGRSVQDILFAPPEGRTFLQSRFGYSIRLVLFASLIAVGVGIPLGVLSVMKPNSWISRFISVGLAALVSVPNFVFGLLTIIILASWLHLIQVLPDWNQPSDWIVPAVVVALMPMASLARVTRASLMNIIREDYIRTARAKGMTESRVMRTHVLRNALVPIITFMGPLIMEMFTGLLIVENLYSFPGFGREYWAAVLSLDYPMILGMTLIYAAGLMIFNVLIELLCEYLDPRLRSVKSQGAP
jgi:ABC-type dipeptide/oligopeptide/nickel transport system permease component